MGICAAIMNKYQIDAIPHIICGGFSKEETESALIDLKFLGVDNILALNLKEKEEYLVTSSRFGAYYPSIADNRILFSDYQSTGEKISIKTDGILAIIFQS